MTPNSLPGGNCFGSDFLQTKPFFKVLLAEEILIF
jgi:hypothetical protein